MSVLGPQASPELFLFQRQALARITTATAQALEIHPADCCAIIGELHSNMVQALAAVETPAGAKN